MKSFVKYTGNCPRNVARDAKYVIRSGPTGPFVSLQYRSSDDETWALATEEHSDLVRMVNEVKLAFADQPNGAFYINEYHQVIVPVVGSHEYYLAGEYHRPIRFLFEGKEISSEPVDDLGEPLKPGDEWVGSRVGVPYVLAAGAKDIYYETTPRPNVIKRNKLSAVIGVEMATSVASQLRKIKDFSGGRFYVNESKAIFSPVTKDAGKSYRYLYVGQVDLDRWFTAPLTRETKTESSVTFKRIALENFKGVGRRQEFELRPITLLFGPNSAGKSTVLHALHYLREVMVRRDANASRSEVGGEFVDFDGFHNAIHNRDPSHQLTIGVGFECDLSEALLSERLSSGVPGFLSDEVSCILATQDCHISVTVGLDEQKRQPFTQRLEIEIDDVHFATLKVSELGEEPHIDLLNCFHPMFKCIDVSTILPKAISKTEFSSCISILEELTGLDDGELAIEENHPCSYFAALWAAYCPCGFFPAEVFPDLPGQRDVIPDTKRDLPIHIEWDRIFQRLQPDGVEERIGRDTVKDQVQFLVEVLSALSVEPVKQLSGALEGMRYVGPAREVPERGDVESAAEYEKQWADGGAAWDCLLENKGALTQNVSAWLKNGQLLDSTFGLEVDEYCELGHAALQDIQNGVLSVDDLPKRKRIVFVDDKGALHSPRDVGFGMSQIVPVVVASLAGDREFVMIEQPELHIHPRLQANLGDLFVHGIRNGKQFFLETHSENLVLRLLRRIRNSAEQNGQQSAELALLPKDVQVLYVLPAGHELNRANASVVVPLPISAAGDFLDEWPDGFFEERDTELFG